MKIWLQAATAIALLCGAGNLACSAENNENCNANQPSHYTAAPGDKASETAFTATRDFSDVQRVEINVCSGELQIAPAKDGQHLTLAIAAKDGGASLAEFIQELSVENGVAKSRCASPASATRKLRSSYRRQRRTPRSTWEPER